MNIKFASTFMSGLIVAGSASAAPLQFAGNGHYFDSITTSGLTWNDANALASASTYFDGFTTYQGYLATVTSQDENDFIRGNFTTAGYYLGGQHQGGAASNYGWVTGETWGAYEAGHWASGEPNGDSGGMQYTWTGENGWNDLPANQNFGSLTPGYIVEYAAVPEPASMAVLALGFVALLRKRKS